MYPDVEKYCFYKKIYWTVVIVLAMVCNFGCTLNYSITDLNKKSEVSEVPTGGVGESGPVLIITPVLSSTTSTPISYVVTSERPIDLSSSQFTLVNGEILSISGSGTSYTVLVTPLGAGTVKLIIEAGAVSDQNGNVNLSRSEGVVTYSLSGSSITLLKNINTNEQGSYPNYYTKVGSDYFFTANNGIHGTELWKTDGTAPGTVMVKDIIPGPTGSEPSGLIAYQGKLYFGISIDGYPMGLWVSDGTDSGTHSVKDFGSMSPYINEYYNIRIANNLMFFTATDASADSKLMRSDGTEAGTYVLRSDLAWVYLEGVVGNRVLFRADLSGVTGSEVYYSEGTESTTLILKDINPGSNNGYYGFDLTVSNGVGLFAANDGVSTKLWRTDGTEAGTTLYDTSILSSPKAAGFGFLKSYAGNTYFLDGTNPKVNLGANPLAGYGVLANGRIFYYAGTGSGASLFSTDGLTSRNHMDLDSTTTSWSYRKMFIADNGVFFEVNSAATGWELYFHDGALGAPTTLGDKNSGAASFTSSFGLEGIALNNKFIFAGITATEGEELWVSDGTAVGTILLKDIFIGASSSYPKGFYKDGAFVYFYADNGTDGAELWRTDGTVVGTSILKNINLAPASSIADEFTVVGSEVFFRALDSSHGNELWKSDGTTAGTVLVKDGIANSAEAYPYELRNLNGSLVYIGSDELTYATVWKSDGTSVGTSVIKPGYFNNSGYIGGLTILGTKAYFQGYSSVVGRELFVTDGTDSGTQNLVDLTPGAGSFFDYSGLLFSNITQGLLYFVNETSGNEAPWVSDGSSVLANNVSLGSTMEYATDFFEVGNLTYFNAVDTITGDFILYKSDGTPGGTVEVRNVDPGSSDRVTPLSYVNSKLIFAAETTTSGKELWASDGTTIGTQMIKDINSGATSSTFLSASKEPLGTKTFFVVDDGINGYELWVTDGTAIGTQLLKDINPGSVSSSPSDFVKMGAYVYFSAETATNGRELWRTDGTQGGTVMVIDILPGVASSSPQKTIAFGSKLIFTAVDDQGDREVHIYEP